MIKRLGLLAAVALLALAAFGSDAVFRTSEKAQAAPGTPLEVFDVEVLNCIGSETTPTISFTTNVAGLSCAAETLTTSTSVVTTQNIVLGDGSRLGLPFTYTNPAFINTYPATGSVAGNVESHIDLGCDYSASIGNSDQLLFAALRTRSTAWESSTDIQGVNESYLNKLLPTSNTSGSGVPFKRNARLRADITTIQLQTGPGGLNIPFTLADPVPLNVPYLEPTWGSAPHVQITVSILGGAPNSPTTGGVAQSLCSSQNSRSHFGDTGSDNVIGGAGGAADTPYTTTPSSGGLYASWTSEVSAADLKTGEVTWTIQINCKAIGGSFTDTDGDCLTDTAETGSGTPSACAPGSGANSKDDPDSDNDGLLDGIEVTWRSDPCDADSDNDGRSDLEEMAGTATTLTDPTSSDTDGDGVTDGGLVFDLNNNGTPDLRDDNGDGVDDGAEAINAITDLGNPGGSFGQAGTGASHWRVGFQLQGIGSGTYHEGDNCPNIANSSQTDTDAGTINADFAGDACDNDDDGDGISDDAELTFAYNGFDVSTAGGIQLGGCTNATAGDQDNDSATDEDPIDGIDNDNDTQVDEDPPASQATPLNPLVADDDGDGFRSGPECSAGADPNSNGSAPPVLGSDGDTDGLDGTRETFYRTVGINNGSGGDAVVTGNPDGDGLAGNSDADSDNDGLPDGCEVYIYGGGPLTTDSDGDGTADGSEAAAAAGCGTAVSPAPLIGNSIGVPTDDLSDPVYRPTTNFPAQLDPDRDNQYNATDTDDYGDFTVDDDNDKEASTSCGNGYGASSSSPGTDAADDGTSWDTNCNGVRDGVAAACTAASGSADADQDALKDKVEVCRWGSDPRSQDTDQDNVMDCFEIGDINGDYKMTFLGDVVPSAKAIQLPPASFGKDIDWDFDGSGTLAFLTDLLPMVKLTQLSTVATGGCPFSTAAKSAGVTPTP